MSVVQKRTARGCIDGGAYPLFGKVSVGAAGNRRSMLDQPLVAPCGGLRIEGTDPLVGIDESTGGWESVPESVAGTLLSSPVDGIDASIAVDASVIVGLEAASPAASSEESPAPKNL